MVNWTAVDRLAKAHHLTDPTVNEKSLTRFLKVWWCMTYSRPFKDPLLNQYTLDDLVYEYLCHYYLDPDNDPIKKKKEDKEKANEEAWVKKMLADHANARAKAVKSKPPELSTKFDE